MKKFLLFLIAMVFAVTSLWAQTPQKMSYQAVVRNANNSLVTNQNVSVKVSILQGGEYGSSVYVETHNTITNTNGLMTVEIGEGTPLTGTFASINWAEGPFFLKSEIDPQGGSNYSINGIQQLLSVPYALYANQAGNVPAFAIIPTDTGYYVSITEAGSTPQTFFLRQGTPGPQGPQGPTGATGAAGNDGFSPVVTTTPVEGGTQVTITDANSTQSFTIQNGTNGTNGQDGNNGQDGASAYDLWIAAGNTGSVTDFLNSLKGADGTNGTNGTNGQDGASAYDLWIAAGNTGTVADFLNSLKGADGTNGTNGTNGADGEDGQDGASAYDLWIAAGNTGTVADFLNSLKGADGANGTDGEDGQDGASAYDLWIAAGNTGTVADFLNSLKGADGANGTNGTNGENGQDGQDGASAYDLWIAAGNTGSVADFLNSLKGADGANGTNGENGQNGQDGASAYDLWIAAGNTGSVADFLNSLKGADGANGTNGTNGENGQNGQDGASAYDLWIAAGNTGSVADFLNSLKGADGENGTNGTNGEDGNGIATIAKTSTDDLVDTYTITYTNGNTTTFTVTNGAEGPAGPTGPTGQTGNGISSVAKTSTEGNVDTYTITYTDASTSTFTVTNGTNGKNGISPIVTAEGSGSNVLIHVTDSTGTHTYTIPTTSGEVTQVNADWNAASGVAQILNKPTLSTVATSGSYNDLTNKPEIPTVPTEVSAFNNDAGYITMDSIPANVSAFANDANYITMDSVTAYVNDATLTIQQNGSELGTFTANQSENQTVNITTLTIDDVQAMINSSLGSVQHQLDSLQNALEGVSFLCGTSTVKDYDGNEYTTVKMGSQCWLKQNLRSTHYSDGTEVTSYNHADDNENNDETYGLLYNWNTTMNGAAASDANPSGVQGICPVGWHVPSHAEWTQMMNYVKSQSMYQCNADPNNIGKALASTTGWDWSGSTCRVGNIQSSNNASGFSAFPAGYYNVNGAQSFGAYAMFWKSSQVYSQGKDFMIRSDEMGVQNDFAAPVTSYLSVRCIRDNSSMLEQLESQFDDVNNQLAEQQYHADSLQNVIDDIQFVCGTSTIRDYDGNQYATVKIGNQCWFKQNLRTTHYSNGAEVTNYEHVREDVANDATHGLRYTWNAVMNGADASDANPSSVQGICPVGWHVPSKAEFEQLADYVGNQSQYVCGGNSSMIAKALAADTGWNVSSYLCDVGNDQGSNNATGFSALSTTMNNIYADFWSTTKGGGDYPYEFYLYYYSSYVGYSSVNGSNHKSVRCIKDHISMNEQLQNMGNQVDVLNDQMAEQQNLTDSLEDVLNNATFVCGNSLVKDYDGNRYTTVLIGSQCWMKENLRSIHYSDGTEVENYSHVNGNPNNDTLLGLAYNYPTVLNGSNFSNTNPSGVQGLCPRGWHVPSQAEWEQLAYYVGNQYACDGNSNYIAKALAADTGWNNSETPCDVGYDQAGNNATGFNAIPISGSYADFWSSTYDAGWVYEFYIDYNDRRLLKSQTGSGSVYSVRCVKDQLSVQDQLMDHQNQIDSLNSYISEQLDSLNIHLTNQLDSLNNQLAEQQELIDLMLPHYTVPSSGSKTINLGNDVTHVEVYDKGGPNGDYLDSWNGSLTLVSRPNSMFKITGTYATESGYDYLYLYNGAEVEVDNLIISYSGTGSISEAIYTSDDTVTIRFRSDGGITDAGFALSIDIINRSCGGSVKATDVEGNTYSTVVIGEQCWLQENLRTTRYANGGFVNLGDGDGYRRFYPNDDAGNVATYGYLYNWAAVMHGSTSSETNPSGVRGICPAGWHVPSDAEWTQLTNYVKDQNAYLCNDNDNNIAKALASTTGWNSSATECHVGNDMGSNNATGFNALPAGSYNGSADEFGQYANFWTATEVNGTYALSRYLYNASSNVQDFDEDKSYAFSVRCVRN